MKFSDIFPPEFARPDPKGRMEAVRQESTVNLKCLVKLLTGRLHPLPTMKITRWESIFPSAS